MSRWDGSRVREGRQLPQSSSLCGVGFGVGFQVEMAVFAVGRQPTIELHPRASRFYLSNLRGTPPPFIAHQRQKIEAQRGRPWCAKQFLLHSAIVCPTAQNRPTWRAKVRLRARQGPAFVSMKPTPSRNCDEQESDPGRHQECRRSCPGTGRQAGGQQGAAGQGPAEAGRRQGRATPGQCQGSGGRCAG